MANKAKHAFGMLENIDQAIVDGKIDSYDILFVKDADGKPYVGWIDAQGNKVLVDDSAEFEELYAKGDSKASSDELVALGVEVANKVSAEEVNTKIETAVSETVSAANAYTDGKIEAAINEHMVKKYEITSVPTGTLVDYRDHEIRVLCPVGTKWEKQNVGPTGNANMYYMGFKAYAPEGAVSFKEGDRGVIIDKMFTFDDDFAGTDEYGRNYSICWLALAMYDATSDTWTYFGKNSSAEKYIGWDYIVEWYDTNGVVIASDCVRINLSNENCHYSTKPYYVGGMMAEIDAKIEEKVAEVNSAYEIVEF